MATLNLGRIKPVFRDAYAGGTAYVVDDIVTFGDETFICILASTGNATSNATYWKKLAAKGTDGTDLTSTITTQGDVLYRDGSGLQRLAKGSAADVLTMNAGATAPEWAASAGGGKVLQVVQNYVTGIYSQNGATFQDFSGLANTSITPSATSSKVLITCSWVIHCSNWSAFKFVKQTGGAGYGDFGLPTGATGAQSNCHIQSGHHADTESCQVLSWAHLDTTNTTSQVDYKFQTRSWNPTVVYINRTSGNGNYHVSGNFTSNVTLWEIGA